jgi:hypothetical protein
LNSPALGWALAVAAVAAGYVGYGWKGVALAITLVVFWLLLQFSRALRVMRQAAGRPVGEVANAVMFNARLKTGLRLMDVLPMTGSLGEKLADDPETFRWKDAGGDAVRIELRHGRVTAWQLERAAADAGS